MRALFLLALCATPALAESPLPGDLGATIWGAACASCHYRGAGKPPFGTRGAPADSSPDELLTLVLFGKAPEEGEGFMPGFAHLTDADIARLAAWLRAQSKPDHSKPDAPWDEVPACLADLRTSGQRED